MESMNTSFGEAPQHSGTNAETNKQSTWTFAEYTSEIGKARRIGPANLSDAGLLGICTRHVKAHFWADVRPFFVELWERIEKGSMPEVHTKAEACRRIGCSLRWAERIIADTARKKTGRKATGNGAPSRKFEPRTNEEYVMDITSYAERKLRPLWASREVKRCLNIYRLLSEHFDDAARIPDSDDLNRRTESASREEAAP
jgi:hypothetical protein